MKQITMMMATAVLALGLFTGCATSRGHHDHAKCGACCKDAAACAKCCGPK